MVLANPTHTHKHPYNATSGMCVLQVEACDVLDGFLLLQSMAGGTGAGVGTYVATALRDEYPATHALNCCVWPYESGEVIVQVREFSLARMDRAFLCLNLMLCVAAQQWGGLSRYEIAWPEPVFDRVLSCCLLPYESGSVFLQVLMFAARNVAILFVL
jgi:tubulin delta